MKIAAPPKDTIHEIKCWPEYFIMIDNQFKNFEVRKNDRDYHIGDFLRIKEWDPKTQSYSGKQCYRRIQYILEGGQFGIEKGYVVMALVKADPISEIQIKR